MLTYKLKTGKMGSYSPTAEDYTWLLRAVLAEGPVQNQVAQTLVNCFCHTRSRGSKLTLTDLVRAYAQPINPRWYVDGDLYKKSKLFGTKAGIASAERREKSHSTVIKFPASVVKAVELALEHGLTDVPANCTDYAAPGVRADAKGYVLLSKDEPRGRNWLWTRDAKWTGYVVV
jgi:hypothetical protein